MPARLPIAHFPSIATRHELAQALSFLVVQRLLSGTQYASIVSGAASALPGEVTVEQRTPKGVTYVCANGQSFSVSPRGKITRDYNVD